jgi:hypothetical protein
MFTHARNTCRWLKYRTTEMCNRRCVGAYCATHNWQIKKGMMTFPCKICGRGISHEGTCVKCFGVKAYQKIYRNKNKHKFI